MSIAGSFHGVEMGIFGSNFAEFTPSATRLVPLTMIVPFSQP